MAVYDQRDPDLAGEMFRLDAGEVEAVADILGAPRMTQQFADLSTGCSIVAVVRDADVETSPEPQEVWHGGDVLVVIGSRQGLEQPDTLLSVPSSDPTGGPRLGSTRAFHSPAPELLSITQTGSSTGAQS